MQFDQEKQAFIPEEVEARTLGVPLDTTWPLSSLGELLDIACIRQAEIASDISLVGLYGAERMRAVVDRKRKSDAVQSVLHTVGLHIKLQDEDFERLLDN